MTLAFTHLLALVLSLPALAQDNSPPVVDEVHLEPAAPTADQDLLCVTSLTDADGDDVGRRIRWLVDGEPLQGQFQPTLAAVRTRRGQSIACEVTPHDGKAPGATVTAAAVKVLGGPPTVDGASLSPAEPTVAAAVECVAGASSDPDGDEVSLRYAWTVAGRAVDFDGAALPPERFRRGQAVECVITPSDGEVDGEAVRAGPVSVANALPVVASVSVSPASPGTSDTLTCEAGESTDADKDAVRLSYGWTADGSPAGTARTLSSSKTALGQSIQCAVTPSDGRGKGDVVSSQVVTVGDSLPVVADVVVAPAPASADDELRCVARGARDSDGQEVSLGYRWIVDGAALAGQVQPTLASEHTHRGQAISCEVTPRAGGGTGEPVTSAPVSFRNAVPVVKAVTLSPRPVGTLQGITAAVEVSDADDDPIQLDWKWTVNGRVVADATGTQLPATAFRKGQSVVASVTPSDGQATGRQVRSAALVVSNTPPPAPVVVVGDPDGGYKDLVCHLLKEVEDDDGDAVSYRFTWSVDGVEWRDAVRTTNRPGDTVPPSATGSDQEWTCTVRAWDGAGSSAPASQSVLILEPRVNAGSGHSCGLSSRGEPWCWGTDEHRAASPPQGDFRRITTGSWHNCVLDTAGAIQCWGHNRYGQCDAPKGKGHTQIDAGAYHTCAVHQDGHLLCWGQGDQGQTGAPAGQFTSVSAGWQHTCAVDTQGQIRCWGDDSHGRASPPQGRFTQVSAGARHTCGLHESGTVVCWGDGEFGQTAVPDGQYVQVRAGEQHACALGRDGHIACWGKDDYGQARPPEGTFLWLGKATNHQCAIDAGAGIQCWGRDNYGQTRVPSPP